MNKIKKYLSLIFQSLKLMTEDEIQKYCDSTVEHFRYRVPFMIVINKEGEEAIKSYLRKNGIPKPGNLDIFELIAYNRNYFRRLSPEEEEESLPIYEAHHQKIKDTLEYQWANLKRSL